MNIGFGEALDRLSILDIKLDKCLPEDVERLTAERDHIRSFVRPNPATDTYVARLKHINAVIWLVEDLLRDQDANGLVGSERWVLAARTAYLANDRRCEIKREADGKGHGEIKVLPRYKKGKIVIVPHLGMGDQLILNGGVRFLSLCHSEVILLVKNTTRTTVEWMYRDVQNVTLVHYEGNPITLNLSREECELRELGDFNKKKPQKEGCFAKMFYDQLGLAYPETRQRFFYVDLDVPDAITVPDHFNFVHDDESRGLTFDLPDNGLPCYRPPTITDGSDNMFKYCNVLKAATEIHAMDSCFSVLADALHCDQKKVIYMIRPVWKELYVNTTWTWV